MTHIWRTMESQERWRTDPLGVALDALAEEGGWAQWLERRVVWRELGRRELCDQLEEGEQRGEQAAEIGHEQRREEHTVVANTCAGATDLVMQMSVEEQKRYKSERNTNTVVEPVAVVVKANYTLVTHATVLRCWVAVYVKYYWKTKIILVNFTRKIKNLDTLESRKFCSKTARWRDHHFQDWICQLPPSHFWNEQNHLLDQSMWTRVKELQSLRHKFQTPAKKTHI